MREVLIGALIVAVLVVLIRTMLATPAIRRIREQFANGGSSSSARLVNTATECPTGTTMYMYEGAAFCCSGTVNSDAEDVKQTCRPGLMRGAPALTFCTLGPTRDGIKNCLETRAGQLQAIGDAVCPPKMPNYAQGAYNSATASGRCCAGPTTADGTDCADTTNAATFCTVSSDPNEFKSATSCQHLKAVAAAAAACPPQYSVAPISFAGQTPMAGLTLPVCTDGNVNCYPKEVIARLKALGYDTKGFPICTATGAPKAKDMHKQTGKDTTKEDTYCTVSTDANEFKSPTSCQYMKMAATATEDCPTNYSGVPLSFAGQGPYSGLTLPVCTQGTVNCYSKAVIARLKELGYDVKGLPVCTAMGTPSTAM